MLRSNTNKSQPLKQKIFRDHRIFKQFYTTISIKTTPHACTTGGDRGRAMLAQYHLTWEAKRKAIDDVTKTNLHNYRFLKDKE